MRQALMKLIDDSNNYYMYTIILGMVHAPALLFMFSTLGFGYDDFVYFVCSPRPGMMHIFQSGLETNPTVCKTETCKYLQIIVRWEKTQRI